MRLQHLLAAAALGLAALAAPALAFAEDVLVVDLSRVYRDSLAGKDAQTKLRTIGGTVNTELKADADGVVAEQQKLGPLKDKSDEEAQQILAGDPSLQQAYQAFVTKAQALEQKKQLRQRELQATEQRAVDAVLKGTEPILNDLLTERKALVVLERNNVAVAAPSVDITQDVITRLDVRLKAVPVTKVDLEAEARAEQQRQAAQQRPTVKR